jgi:hypothetical protein
MFKECVVMPTKNRPEMLALALQHLDRTGRKNLDVRIFLDATHPFNTEDRTQDVEYVRDEYYPDAMIFRAGPHVEVPSGMWNILNALKQGYQSGADRIYLIEEDVCVDKDYFDWHDEAQRNTAYLGVLASCGRYHMPGYNKYTNPGSCFKRDMLNLVVPHINDEMFADRRAYYEKQWGVMDEVSDLDDGMIRRIAKFYGLQVRYPETPKCSHIGFRAYNHYDGWDNTGGSIQYRIARLRHMLSTTDRNNRFTRDFEPLPCSRQ